MLKFIYFILLFIFPIIISILINLKKSDKENKKVIRDIKYLLYVILQITKIVGLIFLVNLLLDGKEDSNEIQLMFLNIVYFVIFFGMIIFINYFSTCYQKFRICIKVYLDALVNFFKSNFILNLFFITLLIFIKNKDLTIGLIGSYFFFVLTTIDKEYKENIKSNNKEFNFIYVISQIILNWMLLVSFTSIEQMISQYSMNKQVYIDNSYNIKLLLLCLIIVINWFLSKIKLLNKN